MIAHEKQRSRTGIGILRPTIIAVAMISLAAIGLTSCSAESSIAGARAIARSNDQGRAAGHNSGSGNGPTGGRQSAVHRRKKSAS